jgi:glutamate dehydrogenase/leucine dehydrogenase
MVAQTRRMMPPIEYVRLSDEAAGLDGIIAIHSTARGPAAGRHGLQVKWAAAAGSPLPL